MTRSRPLALAFLLLAVPALLRLGLWSPGSVGVDAVSAVTPGNIAVVGAGSAGAEGAPEVPSVTDLLRRAAYLSGGIHKSVDAASEWILVRPAHHGLDSAREVKQHVELLRAVVDLLHDVAPEARISLLVGAVPGSPGSTPEGLLAALGAWTAEANLAYLEILDVATEEREPIDVPEGGEAADIYPLPIALLECDALVNVAREDGPFSALRNLEGLAGVPQSDGWTPEARWIDLALLTEASYTLLDMLDYEGEGGAVVLASRDGIAVDRVGMALMEQAASPAVLAAAADRWLGVGELDGIKVNGLDVAGAWVPAPEETEETPEGSR